MAFDIWAAFAGASVLLLLIPGPTVILVMSYALAHGRRVALASAAGVAAGDFAAMSASLLGLGALILASATLFTVLKWGGAAYLVWLGWKLIRSRAETVVFEAPRTEARGIAWHAFVVTALNPKSIAFFIAFVPQFVDPAAPVMPQFIILVGTFVVLAALNVLVYAVLADRLRARIARPSVRLWLARTGGGCLVGMGVLTAAASRA